MDVSVALFIPIMNHYCTINYLLKYVSIVAPFQKVGYVKLRTEVCIELLSPIDSHILNILFVQDEQKQKKNTW